MPAKQKKTAGRPMIPEEEKRTSRMSVGLTEDEHTKFILFAQKQGWSIAELLRNATKDFIKRQEKGR